MKELVNLFFAFARIGAFTFGGGYAMLPMLQKEIVEKNHWATEDEIMDYYAIGHQNLLEAYAAGIPDPSLSLLLHKVGLICSAILLLSAILIVCFSGKRKAHGVKTE